MKGIKAFTLMELLIGMIISSILIAFSYSAYSIIYNQYLTYRNIKKEVSQTMEFNAVFNTDFQNSEFVTFDGNNLTLVRSNSSSLEYIFQEKFIIRKDNEVKDTFQLNNTDIIVKYPVYKEQSLQIVNEFSFNSIVNGLPEIFHFLKKYSAQTLMARLNQITFED